MKKLFTTAAFCLLFSAGASAAQVLNLGEAPAEYEECPDNCLCFDGYPPICPFGSVTAQGTQLEQAILGEEQ